MTKEETKVTKSTTLTLTNELGESMVLRLEITLDREKDSGSFLTDVQYYDAEGNETEGFDDCFGLMGAIDQRLSDFNKMLNGGTN